MAPRRPGLHRLRGADEYAIGRLRGARRGCIGCGSAPEAARYRFGYAESRDGLEWDRDGEAALGDGRWDSEMQAYPAVFHHAGLRHMLYNGNGYGATGIGHAAWRLGDKHGGVRHSVVRALPELKRPLWFRARNQLIVFTIRRYFPDARSFLKGPGCGTGFVLKGLHRGASGS